MALILILLMLSAAPANAQQSAALVPLESEAYVLLEDLCAESGMSPPFGARPFSVEEIEDWMARFDLETLSASGRAALTRLGTLLAGRTLYGEEGGFSFNAGLSAAVEGYVNTGREEGVESLYGYDDRERILSIPLQIDLFDAFHAELTLSLGKDRFGTDQEGDYSNIFTDFGLFDALFPYRAYLSVGGPHWNVSIGRNQLDWGNGTTGNFLLSDADDYTEGILFSTNWQRFRYSFLLASYEPWEDYDPGYVLPAEYELAKTFLAHRIEFRFLDRINLAITESFILAGKTFDFRFLNPFMLYHNFFYSEFANSLLTVEAEITPFRYLTIYGQYGFDQGSAPGDTDQYPGAFAWMAGMRGNIPIAEGYLESSLEWVLTDPWLYLERSDLMAYLSYRRITSNYLGAQVVVTNPIGYELGPDIILLAFDARFRSLRDWTAGLGCSYIVRGEHTMETPYVMWGPELSTPSGANPERTLILNAFGECRLWNRLSLEARLYYLHIEDFDHVAGNVQNVFQGALTVGVTL